MANVKGSSFASRILWVRINQGEHGIERLGDRLGPPIVDLLRSQGAVMSKWYPFDWFVQLNLAIDAEFGSGDLALLNTLGRHGADANLTTIYRLFFKVGTVKWILSRASRLWGMHYDSGQLKVEMPPGRQARLNIVDFDQPHRVLCLSVAGWAQRSIELSGGREVVMDEVACRTRGDAACQLRARWR